MLPGPLGYTEEMRQLTELLQALSLGEETKAMSLIGKRSASSALDITEGQFLDNVTPLIASVHNPQKCCSLSLFKEIIRQTQNLNTQNSAGQTALHHLAGNNQHELLAELLAQGPEKVNVDIQDTLGSTPVHVAAFAGSYAALLLLIRNNADVNLPNKDGRTPLQSACFRGHYFCVQLLLGAGALINAKDKRDRTAVHYLAQSKCTNEKEKLQILNCMLEHGLEINERSLSGVTAYEMAAHFKGGEALVNELLTQRVPTLAFLCTKHVLNNLKDPFIVENYQYMPEVLQERIQDTKRCTST